ncbi:AAA family ATPase [Aliarcobacter butzleri]|uniref:DNA transposition protein n=1 Tax=Aliarcobacter butzleri L352 TaxID=1447260 RepID=A0A837JDI1_9BACT|nr:AAA family ATPase [Aliarcobacter butzleri]KLE05531.1 DNA transposition protein [Aliarcobacter butzleri L352]
MKEKFLHTQNYIKLEEAFQGLKELPISAPKMGLGYGNYGLGKTISLEKITAKEDALLFRAVQTWTKTSVLREICTELNLDTQGQASYLYKRVIESLISEPRILIVDEVDAILKSTKNEVLELFRDIHDETGIIVFFIGMEESNAKFKKHRHYYSRIVALVEFKPIIKEDIKKFCELSDVKIEDDLIDFFYAKYPNLRNIRVLLIRLEKYCELNNYESVDLKIFRESGVEHGK